MELLAPQLLPFFTDAAVALHVIGEHRAILCVVVL